MSESLRETVLELLKSSDRLSLWPRVRVEIFSLENQRKDVAYLSAYRNGSHCEGNPANSWVAYLLGITEQEPTGEMRMISTPGLADIDSDFDSLRRDEVVEIVAAWFGEGSLSHIGTYGQYRIRSAVTDVLKSGGMSPQDVLALTKPIPYDIDKDEGMPVSQKLDLASEASPGLAAHLKHNPDDRPLIEGIVGAYSTLGMHAAGIVMSPVPIQTLVPIARTNKGVVSAYDMHDVEAVGLVKFDFLGVKNVTMVSKCLDLIRERRKREIDLVKEASLEDPACLRAFYENKVDTIFQFETPGFRRILSTQLRAESFTDLVAITALGRPGPKKMVSNEYYARYRKQVDDDKGPADPLVSPIGTYAANKRNPGAVTYPHPALEAILRETYGIPVYQEQAMRIVQALAGWTLSETDKFRKAVGKKQGSLFAKCQENFFIGCDKNGIDPEVAADVWKLLADFGGYGFNKAHAAAYSLLGWWNQWLKEHFSAEWYAAVLTTELTGSSKKDMLKQEDARFAYPGGHLTKLDWYKACCRSHGVMVNSPDVNVSGVSEARIWEDQIYLPLCTIQNVGGNATEIEANAPYTDLEDLVLKSGASPSVLKTVLLGIIEMGGRPFGHRDGPRLEETLEALFVRQREDRRVTAARLRKTGVAVDSAAVDAIFGNFVGEPSIAMGGDRDVVESKVWGKS